MKKIYKTIMILTLFPLMLHASSNLHDESIEELLNQDLEVKSDTGTREQAKNYLDSRNAIDVITQNDIKNSGQTRLSDVLKYYIAGFNAIESSISDGSDHITGFSLRGMSSDQILVLINGKRLHSSAMLHEVGVISRGTSHVDLNLIPLDSIQKIEVLRDAASAQYGTDAISGIINIKLKTNSEFNTLTAHTGIRKDGDGTRYQIDSFSCIPLKYDGFINLSLSAIQQNRTQRAGEDQRLETPEIHTWVGVPKYEQFSALLNSEVLSENDLLFYSNVLVNYKESQASAFYRTPDENRSIFPDGFLPIINAQLRDISIGTGIKNNFGKYFSWDLSNVYGYSNFKYGLNDTVNYTLGASSPINFDNGDLTFIQNTTNLDIKKIINNLTLTGGIEYRYEKYKIGAGDKASYIGTGSQGFSGFSLDNTTSIDRNIYAIYIDTIHKPTHNFSYEFAARYENYSDFGSTHNYKVSLGYKLSQALLLRSSASSGFRAPSLSQSGYTHTSSFATEDGLSLRGIFQPNHDIAKALGAEELKPEDSTHYTLGIVYEYSNTTWLMLDYFYTKVDDRILLSDNITASTPQQQEVFEQYNVTSASYFANSIDSKTQGFDLKLNTSFLFNDDSKLTTKLWYHYNKTEITSYNKEISYAQSKRIEHAQPRDAIRLLNHYESSNYNISLNFNRFAEYYHVLGSSSYKFGSILTTDLNINYEIDKNIELSLGGNNIFDVMPDKWEGRSNPYLGYDGILQYSNNSPIGYSGAYYYLKAKYAF